MNKSNKLQNEQLLLVKHRAKEHLIDFSIATNPKYDPNWHHEIIANELEHIEKYGDRDYKILVITMPPRSGKSELCSINFPAWYLGKNPDKEIITSSYSGELSQDFGAKTREKVSSRLYNYIFNVTLKEDEQSRSKWRTDKGGAYTSVGVGGPITGRGSNVLLIDDPIKNREEAESDVYRKKVWEWFTSTAFTRLEPNGVVIVIMTRWHTDDLVGRILSNPQMANRTKVIHFPAIATKDEIHRKQGEALWPKRFGIKALEEIKATIGPYDWSALYQGSPVLTENQEFKPEWIRKITEAEVSYMSCQRYLTVDTAMSQRTSADFTGFCDNSVNKENFWNIRAWRMKISPVELVNTLFTLHTKHNYTAIGIEKTAYYVGLKPYLDEEQIKRGIFLPIVELQHNQTQKEIRIRGLLPRYASGSIFHIDTRCRDLEEEQIQFPLGQHDDVLDALAYQLQITQQESQLGTFNVYVPEDF